ncbi:MAG: hypothetical protein KC416_15710, partial [Myxococcales bacterium]|nr:hypothetical protein [Myxococcales bacterium]
WLDVSHTEEGGKTLARWLSAPAEPDVIGTRRGAVEELANHIDLREELEAAGAMAATEGKLSATPFLAFTKAPALFATRPWLTPLIVVLPVATWVGIVAHLAGWAGPVAWTIPLVVQIGILVRWGGQASAMFELVSSRKGYVEAYSKMLRVTEEADVQSEHLRALKGTMSFDSIPPSTHMRRLDRWAGFADLRTQFPVHLFVNVLTLWDLHVLRHLEAWNRDVGTKAAVWFEALGEWEALASLAVLPALHEGAHFPEIGPEGSAFEVEALAHPLLPAKERVANDVHLGGPGTALIVTGSNMAGKSTLLRSVGLNIVLSLAGGATTAKVFKTPRVRLRASMRANDNLQKGASYFHAELTKLRTVVEDADQKPPLFFLLDELLRGTNAHAAHLGAQSVVKHLLDRGAMGLIATHDVALGDLPAPHRDHVQNAHFTDVMRDGEMVFDYRLREGIVETSNALRLLSMAGIEVPDDTRVR